MEQNLDTGLVSLMQANEKIVLLDLHGEKGKGQEFQAGQRQLHLPCEPRHLVNLATGMGLYGLYPVVKLSLEEFLDGAYLPLRTASAEFRYRSGGQFAAPMAVVVEYDNGLLGEALALQIPGMQIFAPVSEMEYTNLLEALSSLKDPSLVFRPKQWSEYPDAVRAKWEMPLAIQKARVLREGSHATIVAYGSMVKTALEAADALAAEGKELEVVDLRCLSSLDLETVLASVRKTSRLILVQDSQRSFGVGSELAALVAESAMDILAAPICRIAGMDVPIFAGSQSVSRPNLETILFSIRNLSDF